MIRWNVSRGVAEFNPGSSEETNAIVNQGILELLEEKIKAEEAAAAAAAAASNSTAAGSSGQATATTATTATSSGNPSKTALLVAGLAGAGVVAGVAVLAAAGVALHRRARSRSTLSNAVMPEPTATAVRPFKAGVV